MPFYTTQIAAECNISMNTARNWAREYKEVLSPGASVEGEQRVFDDRDREVFKLIAQLRAEKLRRDEIIERVKQTNFGEIVETGASIDDQPTALAVAPNELSQTPDAALIAAMFDAHARRIEALEQSRAVPVASNRMADMVLGFLAACAFLVLILLLAVLYGR